MYIDVEINENIEIVDFLNEDLYYLGNIVYSDSAALFFEHQDLIYKYSSEGTIQNLDNLIYLDSNRVYSYLNEFEYTLFGKYLTRNDFSTSFQPDVSVSQKNKNMIQELVFYNLSKKYKV